MSIPANWRQIENGISTPNLRAKDDDNNNSTAANSAIIAGGDKTHASSSGNAGDLTLRGGNASGSGSGGHVNINAGTGTSNGSVSVRVNSAVRLRISDKGILAGVGSASVVSASVVAFPIATSDIGLAVYAQSGATGDYLQALSSAGSVLSRLTVNQQLILNGSTLPISNEKLQVNGGTASDVAASFKVSSSQTADVIRALNASDVAFFGVRGSAGKIYSNTTGPINSAQITAVSDSNSTPLIVVKQAASQAADTLTVQNSSGTTVFQITSNSAIKIPNTGHVETKVSVDSSSTGANASILTADAGYIQFSNASLSSISGIAAGADGQKLTIANKTGNAIAINNQDTGVTANTRIITGSGSLVQLSNDASLDLIYDNTNARWTVVGGTGSGSTSSSSNPNYITNPGAEAVTTGWSTFADAAASRPVDGTGGSPNSTWTRSTSTPLRGTGSFLWTKSGAANRQGEGVSYDFTIDTADKAKPLSISFDYTISSGTYSGGTSSTDSDLIVYIYDVTNAALIEPVGFKLDGAVAGVNYTYNGVFQTASNSSSYRLIIYTATTSTSNYVLQFDNFYVGTQRAAYGVPSTQWTSYTLSVTSTGSSPSLGSVTTNSAYYRRVGDSCEIMWNLNVGAGSDGTGVYLMSLPSGITIDTNVIAASTDEKPLSLVGQFVVSATNAARAHGFTKVYSTTALQAIIVDENATGTYGAWGPGGGGGFGLGSARQVTMTAKFPVTGWSSNVQMSTETDTRVVAAGVTGTPAATGGAAAYIYPTVTYDTHSGYNASTGRYTAPVAGIYNVSTVLASTNAVSVDIYVNGSSVIRIGSTAANVNFFQTLSGSVKVNAGDIIDIRSNANSGTNGTCFASFERLSGPSQIAASEKVIVKYQNTAGTSITSTKASVPFATKLADSHSCFDGTTFTAPAAGAYRVSATLFTQAVNNSTSQALNLYFLVTSTPEALSADSQQAATMWGGGTSRSEVATITRTFNLVAGNTVAIQADNSNTVGLNTSAGRNIICIEKI